MSGVYRHTGRFGRSHPCPGEYVSDVSDVSDAQGQSASRSVRLNSVRSQTMTIRDYLRRQWWSRSKFTFAALIPSLLWIVTGLDDRFPYWGLVFLAAIFGGAYLHVSPLSRISCPRCGVPFGSIAVRVGANLIRWGPIKMCPHCGVSFDEPYEQPPSHTA